MDAQKLGFKLEVRPTIRARSPRELLIFNLDDTLIDTNMYWLSRAAFARAAAAKIGEPEEEHVIGAYEPWNMGNKRLDEYKAADDSVTMRDAWQAFQKVCDIPQESDSGLYLMMARSLRASFPAAIPGAEDLLQWAQSRFTLALLTCGDSEVQLRKLDACNLRSYFKEVKIVPSKAKEDYLAVISQMGFSPRNSWVVGGSIRSDINPGLAAGANCIHCTYTHMTYNGSRRQLEEPTKPIFRIHDLVDVKAVLAKTSTCIAA